MPGPLAGVRVVDFTIYQNGPSATVRLAEEGAVVIKVEPFAGEGGRYLAARGSKPHNNARHPLGRLSFGVEAFNRGKRSVAVDLKHPRAAEVIRRLVRWADVLAENFRPGVMDRLGFGYERCREWNPRLIYASNSGFGPRGARAQDKSYDAAAQAYSGVAAFMGGGPGRRPRLVPWTFSDEVGAQHFHSAIVTALFARERAGEGQHVVTSQTAATLRFQRAYLEGAMFEGREPGRGEPPLGDEIPAIQFQRASDGRWFIAVLTTPPDWVAYCDRVLERPDLLKDPRGSQGPARVRNKAWLNGEVAAVVAKQPLAEWLRRCRAAGVTVAPVNGYVDIGRDEHLRANGYVRDVEHPKWGRMTVTGPPTAYSATPVDAAAPYVPGPGVGEHTAECLADVGFSAAEIAGLEAARAVMRGGAAPSPRL